MRPFNAYFSMAAGDRDMHDEALAIWPDAAIDGPVHSA